MRNFLNDPNALRVVRSARGKRRWTNGALATVLCLSALPLHAQFETASVLGYVRDSSGAPVVNSKVQLINVATGVAVTVMTDAQGQYQFTDVHNGQYKIDSSAEGFSETETSPFTVAVNTRQRVDVSLKPGSVSETITVSGAASQLESETSDSGTLISQTEVRNLPLNGRAYADLALLAPGVRANTLENSSVTSRDASFNANGQRSEFNNFLLDGLDNNAYGTSNQGFSNQAIPPSPDAISEFRVETNNYSAEYGRASGAVINVSINNGTNNLHGRVWEYNRNTSFNALGPFQSPVSAVTGKKQIPVLIRNQFGGALGGPIKKDKLFFFADYEGNRQVQGQYTTATIPTAQQRQGIFVGATGAPVALHNPITGVSYANGIIPQSEWTPLAQLVIAALPSPNVAGFSNNYASFAKASLIDNKGDGRVDYYMSPKTSIFGRYSEHRGDIVDASSIPGLAGGGGNGSIHAYNKQVASGVTHNFTQNQILDARIGFTWTQGGKTPYLAGVQSLNTQAGIPGLPTDPTVIRALSSENITNFTSFGAQNSNPQFQNPFVIDPKANYTILAGRHSIKIGWEYLSLNTEIDDFNPVYGSENFGGAFSQYQSASATLCPANAVCGTSDLGARQATYLADFLLGARSSYQLNNFVIINQHQRMNFGYVQDDIKVSPRLTVNAGLRYENATPPVVDGNHLANFDPSTNTLIQAKGGSTFDRALVHTPKLDFAPRFGLSFQVDPKTVIRSAYGLSFDQFNREGGENLLAYNGPYIVNSAITQVAPFTYSTVGTGQPVCGGEAFNNCFRTVAQGYPDNFATPANFSTALAETRYIPKNIPTGYVQTWHLDVQREVAPNTVFTVSYVGSHGVHLWVLADLNQSRINAPGQKLGVNQRRPIAGFIGIEESIPAGFQSYNALQTKLEHRFSRGLYVLNSFTYSRSIDNASGHLDTPNGDNSRVNLANINGDRGESAYDQPLNNTTTIVWDLPYGKGRMFGDHAPRALDMLLGEWQLSVINSSTSGQPVNLNYSETPAQDVSDILVYRPNVNGKVVTPESQHVKTATSLNNYFSSTAVTLPTGTNPFGSAGRNSVRGPLYNDMDIGLHKGFRLWSDSSLIDIRGEAFNILNHVNYMAPSGNRSSGSFGQITSAYTPRVLQVAAKLSF